jgi:hypothetical protein
MPEFELCRVTGTAGKVGTPGAPILHYDLLYDVESGTVSGQAKITQAIAGGEIVINNVTGVVRKLIFGGTLTLVISLKGTYTQKGPPPTEYVILEHFTAHFSTDVQWNGRGSFDYGTHVVNDVPVKSTVVCTTGPIIRPLYMATVHDATTGGDLARMKDVLNQAEAHIAASPEIQKALPALKDAIKKAGG